ncbi:Ig-like domain-containing protein, partial [Butyrivibrio sp. WCD3002]|uniref:Ig-like domain-containing protein n=1 Tax=Butyrivibrio sp. WCD3002 TaxID=1280676 RepID=UPI0018CAC703
LYMENSNKLKVPANLNAVICSNVDITAGADTVINKMTISEGKKVNFEGDFTAEGDVKVNNRAELRVTGDYLQKNGVFEPVGTDVIAEIDGSFSVINSGAIWNNDVTTTVSISGDFLYNSTSGTQLNAATWKVKGDVTQGTKNGRCYIGTLELLTKGATLDIDNGRISTLVIDCGISNFDIPKVCYDKVRATVKGTFDANGGVLSDRSTLITSGDKFGQLPTPTLNGKDFDGWFTEKNGGDKITKDTVSEFIDDFTIYAHWTDKEVEDPGQQEQDPIDTGVAIKVTRVSLDYTSVELEVGDEYQLTASVMPKNATNKEVQWSSNVASIATVSDTGLVTAVSEGSATITVKTVDGRKTATCLVRVTRPVVAPAKVKLSSVKNSKAKTTTVKWNKLNGVDGYEIEYALNKKFTKTRKTKDVNSGSAKSATIKKLKKGKTYYFRIRAYAFDSHGQKVYGDWCAAKKVKIKK